MSKKQRKKNQFYFNQLTELSKKENFSPIEIINTIEFTQNIATGSETFKLKILDDILNNKVSVKFNFAVFKTQNQKTYESLIYQINNIKNYHTFIKLVTQYEFRRLVLKYLNKTMTDIEKEKQSILHESKKIYLNYVEELKQITVIPKNIYAFIGNKINYEKFNNIIGMVLNKDNLFLIIKPSQSIINNYNNLISLENKLKLEQQEKIFNENKLKYISTLKNIAINYKEITEFISQPHNNKEFHRKVGFQLTESSLFKALETPLIMIENYFKTKKEEQEKLRLIAIENTRLLAEKQKLAYEKAQALKEQKALDALKIQIQNYKTNKNISYKDILNLLTDPLTCRVLKKETVSEEDLFKYFKVNLKKEKQHYIENDLKEINLLKKYNQSSLIHNMYVGEILNISPTELKKWKLDGRLVVEEQREFKKWGKILSADYFSPKFLLSITPETIDSWRLEEKIKKQSKVKNLPSNQLTQLHNYMTKAHDFGFHFDMKHWYAIDTLTLEKYEIKSLVKLNFNENINDLTFLQLKNRLIKSKKDIILSKESAKLESKIKSHTIEHSTYLKLLADLSKYTQLVKNKDFTITTIPNFITQELKVIFEVRKHSQLISQLKLNEYEYGFPLARGLDRKIKIIVGPTNSGKTYEAVEHLKSAKSGVYLAPLRLLAMEIYDKLIEDGVPCNLITGEEKIIDPNAHHTASTIEMFSPTELVEVAIIDEFQMLADTQRGWAWTSAMVGVPAQNVYVIGNHQHLPLVEKLYQHLNEKYEVIKKERFNPLKLMDNLVDLKDIQKGDAIIAFSRKDVLSYATLLKNSGFKTSIIYGALSPEIRRQQSELFKNGLNDIVVSTDAIGMGLNLPIKRVLFATTEKYDGECVRTLSSSEFLQIAGRAGRYGMHDKGEVGLLNNKINQQNNNLSTLKYLFNSDLGFSDSFLNVIPSNSHIEIIAKNLKTKNLQNILKYFSNLNFITPFSADNLVQQCMLYAEIKSDIKNFDLLTQYQFLKAPVELHNEDMIDYYKFLINEISENNSVSFYFDKIYSLEFAEQLNKKLTIFSWLSFYFENLNYENINDCRKELTEYIQKALIRERMIDFSRMIEPKETYYRNHYYDNDD